MTYSENNLPNTIPIRTHQQGWECPKCGSVYAPFMMECSRCNNKITPAIGSAIGTGM